MGILDIGALQSGSLDIGALQGVSTLIALSPSSGTQGQSLTLTVTGTNTHFASGTTTVAFSGSGVTVGTITVASATSLTAAITIASGASAGARTVTVSTGTEAPTASFTITVAAPSQRGNIDYDQIRASVRQGTGGKFQMFAGAPPVTGHLAVFDASGNVMDGGVVPGGGGGGSIESIVGFIINTGVAGVNVGPMLVAPGAGSVSACAVVVKASDAAVALGFIIKRNGVSVFTGTPTISAGAVAGTVYMFTGLTSVPLSVFTGDVFTIDITSGSASWVFTAQLES